MVRKKCVMSFKQMFQSLGVKVPSVPFCCWWPCICQTCVTSWHLKTDSRNHNIVLVFYTNFFACPALPQPTTCFVFQPLKSHITKQVILRLQQQWPVGCRALTSGSLSFRILSSTKNSPAWNCSSNWIDHVRLSVQILEKKVVKISKLPMQIEYNDQKFLLSSFWVPQSFLHFLRIPFRRMTDPWC